MMMMMMMIIIIIALFSEGDILTYKVKLQVEFKQN